MGLDRDYPWRTKVYGATSFLLTVVTGGWLIRNLSLGTSSGVLTVALFGLAIGLALLFYTPRLGYSIAFVSAAFALYWFSRSELGNFPALNSWILLNLPDNAPSLDNAQLRIALGATLIASSLCSLVALIPAKWCFRKKSIRDRAWLAFALSLTVVAFWYFKSVAPYRLPVFADGPRPELAILHVQKDGLQFNETRVSIYSNGMYEYSWHDRRLFQYKFPTQGGVGVLPLELFTEAQSVAASPFLSSLHTPQPKPLRAWRGDGWYVYTRRGRRFLAFTTEYRAEPPERVVNLFRKLVAMPPVEKPLPAEKDVCLGFCYDPQAGLQMANLNDRCRFDIGSRCD